MATGIHKLAKLSRDQYDNIVTPDDSTLYFTIDKDKLVGNGELYVGAVRIGSGFIWTDGSSPRPERGVPGYFYIDRQSLDMYIWNENLFRWVYFGNVGDSNGISINQFYKFRDELLERLSNIQSQIDTLNRDHLYTEKRIKFTTDNFTKVPDTDYYAITLSKDKSFSSLLVKNVYAHIDGSDSYQAIYPDITETSTQIVLQFTIPADGFCILS